MGYKPTIIAFVLAVVGVLSALYMARTDPARTSRSTSAPTPLVTAAELPVDEVTRITLTRRGQEPMVFERTGPNWLQIEPFAYPMDRYSMRQLVAVAHQAQVVQRLTDRDLDDATSDTALGFDPPEAEVTYQWGDQSLRMTLGRRGIAGRAYLRKGVSNDVLVVRQDLHERAVEMDPKEWRDRTIFQNAGIESDRIVRSDGRNRLVLVRDRRDWRMVEPVDTRIDNEALAAFMQALGGARSGGFLVDQPRDLARFGLEPAAAEFSITTSRGPEGEGQAVEQRLLIGMLIGAGTQDRYGLVEGRPTVIRVPVAVQQALFRPPVSLIDSTASGVIPADVRSVRINTAEGELHIERDQARWRAPDHGNAEVPAGYMDELLAQLTQLRAGELSIQPYPQELEVATVTMFGFRGLPIDTVRIVREPMQDMWGLENGDNVLRIFPSGFDMRLTPEQFGLTSVLE